MSAMQQLLENNTNRLVLINVLVFFFFQQMLYPERLTGLELFSWQTPQFAPWQFLTSMFLHGSVPHLLFNMIALWSFGRVLERVLGAKRFLVFYLACGVGAGIIKLIIETIVLQQAIVYPSLGASGAVYGLLVAFAMLFPNFKIILIFLPVPIAAKYFVPVIILIDMIGGFTGNSIFGHNIAHFAHLGGAIMGFVLLQFWLIPSTRR